MWDWNHNQYFDPKKQKKKKTTAEVNQMLIIRFQSGLPGIGIDSHIQN
jgi:hypothetical protein